MKTQKPVQNASGHCYVQRNYIQRIFLPYLYDKLQRGYRNPDDGYFTKEQHFFLPTVHCFILVFLLL